MAASLAAGVVLGACTPTQTASSSPSPQSPHWTVGASVKVGQTPGPVTLGGQWAFVANMSDGTVTQIERKTGKAVATISVADPKVLRAQGCAPDSVHAYYSGSWGWRLCDTPYAIGWDGAGAWAVHNRNAQLVPIDPSPHKTAE